MGDEFRASVRVVCLDSSARVLLLQWRDPSNGELLWEPPGGGIEAGESPVDAARRELVEETGLDPDAVENRSLDVARDAWWKGRRHVGIEPFFVARFAGDRLAVSRDGLLEEERQNLVGHEWLGPEDLAALVDRVEPPNLASVVAALDPGGSWARSLSPERPSG